MRKKRLTEAEAKADAKMRIVLRETFRVFEPPPKVTCSFCKTVHTGDEYFLLYEYRNCRKSDPAICYLCVRSMYDLLPEDKKTPTVYEFPGHLTDWHENKYLLRVPVRLASI